MNRTSDLRIADIKPLVPPRELKEALPMSERSAATVVESRTVVDDIISGRDQRLLAVIGPCSIHDPAAALDFASRLNDLRNEVMAEIFIVMRVYFEKPRTRRGWRGLILDPHLDGSSDIHAGLHTARSLLLKITAMGLPAGSEMLDPVVPQYTSDLLTWASIGARTTESQTHREMASGLSMPVGFKNGTDGSIETAINAMSSARGSHSFIGIDQDGQTAVFTTSGNGSAHIILRGGRNGPNYHDENVDDACRLLIESGFPARLMVDCSHANALREHSRQGRVLKSLIRQRLEGQKAIIGFMLESNIREGNQPVGPLSDLTYGVSVTDACMGWERTEELIHAARDSLATS